METTFSNMNLKMSFPTDGAKLVKRELVSQSGQMELLVGASVSSIKVTGVVPATTPPMPKSEQ